MAEHCKLGYQINIFAGKVPKFWEVQRYDENLKLFLTLLKVSQSRKQILKFSFEPKNEQKYFCISAHFRELGQKYENIFVWFLVQMKTSKFAFEINWP